MKIKLLLMLVVVAVFMLVATSCKKETPYMSDATITGYDQRLCVCCGGLMVKFNESEFRLIANSEELGISQNENFPINVKVDWKEDSGNPCNKIIITRFARR